MKTILASILIALLPSGAVSHSWLSEPKEWGIVGGIIGGIEEFAMVVLVEHYQQGCFIGCDHCEPELGTGGATTDPLKLHPMGCTPMEPTIARDDEEKRTWKDGPPFGDFTMYHPWRAPGFAPVKGPCGAGDVRIGGFSPTATHWKAGGISEVSWSIVANHGGGVQYRLCPFGEESDEKCFQQNPLAWATDYTKIRNLYFGPGGKRQAVDVCEGTWPENSCWRRNALSGEGIDIILTKVPLGSLVDWVQVPLLWGDYVLSLRWDVEETSQIWTHCADIHIEKPTYNMHSIQLAWHWMKCVNLPNDKIQNGDFIGIWDCNGFEAQEFMLQDGSIKSRKDPSKCLDVPGGNVNNGQELWLWDCDGSDNQMWTFNDDGNSLFLTASEAYCLDVPAGDTANGATLGLWECNGLGQQAWLVPAATQVVSGDFCLDLPAGNVENGQELWVWECSGGENQAWVWSNWNLRFGPDTNKCLDLPGGSLENGQKLWLWDCSGDDSQQWGYNQDTGSIYPASDVTKCLDLPEGGNGAFLQIWDCNQLSNQQWALSSLIDAAEAMIA